VVDPEFGVFKRISENCLSFSLPFEMH
jgi:hypothetical protein